MEGGNIEKHPSQGDKKPGKNIWGAQSLDYL